MLNDLFTPTKVKPWYKSRTLIFNMLTITGTLISWGLDYLTPMPMLVIGLVVAQMSINIILRFVTKEPIK